MQCVVTGPTLPSDTRALAATLPRIRAIRCRVWERLLRKPTSDTANKDDRANSALSPAHEAAMPPKTETVAVLRSKLARTSSDNAAMQRRASSACRAGEATATLPNAIAVLSLTPWWGSRKPCSRNAATHADATPASARCAAAFAMCPKPSAATTRTRGRRLWRPHAARASAHGAAKAASRPRRLSSVAARNSMEPWRHAAWT
mmetsp:Transcript_34837/g.97260  ORF Transcript_34837/g.97260 Transcript_34837/m.97260 type:complete len:203 (-) Transcript_34837:288-896(-)